MKKLFFLFALLIFAPAALAGTYTTKNNLYKPAVDETGWGNLVHNNWDIIDTFSPQHEVDALLTFGNGTEFTQATIEAALVSIGTSTPTTLLLRPGTWIVTSTLTIPKNILLKMASNAKFAGDTGTKNLIINGGIDAEDSQQIFDITNLVVGGTPLLNNASVKWFGALGDASNDDTAEIQAAVNFFKSTLVPPGKYKVSSTITMTNGAQRLSGTGGMGYSNVDTSSYVGSTIYSNTPDLNMFVIDAGVGDTEHNGPIIENINFMSLAGGGTLLKNIRTNRITLKNCVFRGAAKGYEAYIDRTTYPSDDASWGLIEQCFFLSNTTAGIYIPEGGDHVIMGGDFTNNGWAIIHSWGEIRVFGIKVDGNQLTGGVKDAGSRSTFHGCSFEGVETAYHFYIDATYSQSGNSHTIFGGSYNSKDTNIDPRLFIADTGVENLTLYSVGSGGNPYTDNGINTRIDLQGESTRYNIDAADYDIWKWYWRGIFVGGFNVAGENTLQTVMTADPSNYKIYLGGNADTSKFTIYNGVDEKTFESRGDKNATVYGTEITFGGVLILQRSSSPEGAAVAPPGSLCVNTAGGAGTTLYVKESGVGNTGWVGK